jgi:ABC-type branched-subunit amino acid transport system ATPase component
MTTGADVELAVEALTIRFGGLTAVDAATFEVRKGEVLSLIGPNGAGKTTAFNAITGYAAPASGELRYRQARLNGLEPNAIAALGVVRTFQKTSVFTGQTVHGNVAIGLHLQSKQRPLAILLGLPSVAREERVLPRRRPGSCASSGSRHARTMSPHRFPMGSCGCWKSPSRWPPSPGCCSSTSPCPA